MAEPVGSSVDAQVVQVPPDPVRDVDGAALRPHDRIAVAGAVPAVAMGFEYVAAVGQRHPLEGGTCLGVERDGPVLVALPLADMEHVVLEVDVLHAEVTHLLGPQAGIGAEQHHAAQRAVGWVVREEAGGVDGPGELGIGERTRAAVALLGSHDAGCGWGGDEPLGDGPPVEGVDRECSRASCWG